MTWYFPAAEDAESMSVACLLGRRLVAVEAPEGAGEWTFRFEGGSVLNVGGWWRVVATGRVAVTGDDHGHPFGLGVPVDAAQRALDAAAGGVVADAGFDATTGDLRVVFANGARIEALTCSSGYESWTLNRPDGRLLTGGGGGAVHPSAPGPPPAPAS